MARNSQENGVVASQSPASVKQLTRARFRRTTLDAFAEDFSAVLEAGADDVVNGRLSPAEWNAVTRSYALMIQMMDLQMRAKAYGFDPTKRLRG